MARVVQGPRRKMQMPTGRAAKQMSEGIYNMKVTPWPGGSVGWSVIPCTKGCRFNPQSGHIPRLWV